MNSISSDYFLKLLFSHLDYEYFLKLLKNNKALQKRSGLKKDNYEELMKYKYTTTKLTIKIKNMDETELNQIIYFIFIATFSLVGYIFIFSTILYFIGPFNESNLKENYDANALDMINKINMSLYLLDIILSISYFIISRFIIKTFYYDNKKNINIKRIILLIINIIYIYYEVQIIRKISLSYTIKNSNFLWFMIFDYILLVLFLLYIILMLVSTYKYFRYAGTGIETFDPVILKRYRNIEIYDCVLPKKFLNMTKKGKANYLKNNSNEFKHSFTQKNKDLMEKINEYRLKNDSNSCYFENTEKIPKYIIHGLSEEKLFPHKNVFKLPKRSYLFKYKKNTFEQNLNNIDKDIILDKIVNKLSVTEIGEYEYIFLSDDIEALFGPISLDDNRNGNLNLEQNDIYDFEVQNLDHED